MLKLIFIGGALAATSLLGLPAQAQTQGCPSQPVSLFFFEPNNADLTAQHTSILDAVRKIYQDCGETQLLVAGHADTSGSFDESLELSQGYATAVRDYLVSVGIPRGAISTQAFGEARPRVETADGVSEPQNRRVEIIFYSGIGW